VKINPKNPHAHYDRAHAYSRRDEYDRAIEDNNEALRLKPDDPDAFRSRGLTYLGEADYDHAIQDFGEALRLRPDYVDAFNDRGITNLHKVITTVQLLTSTRPFVSSRTIIMP
jgi:tetratricopeptide (TPR) repeat protein